MSSICARRFRILASSTRSTPDSGCDVRAAGGSAVEADRTIILGASGIVSLLYLAVLASALAFSLYYWVLKRVAATRLSLITLAIPVVAVAVGTTLLNEPFSVKTGLGYLLILLGVRVASRSIAETPRRVDTS